MLVRKLVRHIPKPTNDDLLNQIDDTILEMRRIKKERKVAMAKIRVEADEEMKDGYYS